MSDIPFVAIGNGEKAPWADLPLTCPECGAGPLELESTTSDTGLITLHYIQHCNEAWLRGPLDIRVEP